MEKEISLPIKVIEEDAATLGYVFNSIEEIDKNKHDDKTLILFSCIASYSPKESSELDYYSLLLSSYLEDKLEQFSEGKISIPHFDPYLNVSPLEEKLSIAALISK